MDEKRDWLLTTVTILAQAIELRDRYTAIHSIRVTHFSLLLAQQLGLPSTDLELLRVGTHLHDIGKIGIPDAILHKPGRLTADEDKEMRRHTLKGEALISTLPFLNAIQPIVRSHHEQWDGLGYPDGLAGDRIPLLARVVAVANAFDVTAFDTPYHRGVSHDVAFAEVRKQAGRQFDPSCAAAFLAVRQQITNAINEKIFISNVIVCSAL